MSKTMAIIDMQIIYRCTMQTVNRGISRIWNKKTGNVTKIGRVKEREKKDKRRVTREFCVSTKATKSERRRKEKDATPLRAMLRAAIWYLVFCANVGFTI